MACPCWHFHWLSLSRRPFRRQRRHYKQPWHFIFLSGLLIIAIILLATNVLRGAFFGLGPRPADFELPTVAATAVVPTRPVDDDSPGGGAEVGSPLPPTNTPVPSPTAVILPTHTPTVFVTTTPTQVPPLPTQIIIQRPTATATAIRPTVQPTATALPTTWRGEYFANRTLSGTPVFVRDDVELSFDWGNGSPGSDLSVDGFSVRWQRPFNFQGGTYRFYARGDGGICVYVDNGLIIDQWHEAGTTTYVVARTLAAGIHALRVEYYENTGRAQVQIWWELAGDFPQWRGDYYNNATLSGAPVFSRNDGDVNFNWGSGSPDGRLAVDNFSARWTRTQTFDNATYRFRATIDDGIRVYLDGTLILEDWREGGRRDVTADVPLAAGQHLLRVDYFERGGDARVRLTWEKLSGEPALPFQRPVSEIMPDLNIQSLPQKPFSSPADGSKW